MQGDAPIYRYFQRCVVKEIRGTKMKYPFETDTKTDLTEDNPFFLEGKEAYKHGYPIGDCVYPSGSKMRKFWMKGYSSIPDAVANTLKRCHQSEASKKIGARAHNKNS
jgi:hypothetical protein